MVHEEIREIEEDFEEDRVNEKKLMKEISGISTKLMYITNNDEKIQLIVQLNSLLKENIDLIKKKYPDILVSILDSL